MWRLGGFSLLFTSLWPLSSCCITWTIVGLASGSSLTSFTAPTMLRLLFLAGTNPCLLMIWPRIALRSRGSFRQMQQRPWLIDFSRVLSNFNMSRIRFLPLDEGSCESDFLFCPCPLSFNCWREDKPSDDEVCESESLKIGSFLHFLMRRRGDESIESVEFFRMHEAEDKKMNYPIIKIKILFTHLSPKCCNCCWLARMFAGVDFPSLLNFARRVFSPAKFFPLSELVWDNRWIFHDMNSEREKY